MAFVAVRVDDVQRRGRHRVPRRHHRELRRQPDLAGPRLRHLRGLGRGGRAVRRAPASIHGRRAQLAADRDRQRLAQRRHDRPVPAVGGGRSARSGRRRVLRPPRRVPRRREHPPRAPRRRQHVHRRVVAGLQGHGRHGRGGSRRRQRARLPVHLGSGPATAEGGRPQYPSAGHTDPCPHGRGFIGDYFALAISNGNIYTFGVSTHYPSATVTADDGGPVYYQNQVLGVTPRATFGRSY